MDVRGRCECGHDAKDHAGIDGRFAYSTPCSGTVLGPVSFSGNVQRTMSCTCDSYVPDPPKVSVPA